jgi:outer membrane protein insertion porin family
MIRYSAAFLAVCLVLSVPCSAQISSPATVNGSALTPAQTQVLEILGLSVEGVDDEYTKGFIQQTSRLTIGQSITVPGDPAFGDAIRAIYRLGNYEDVQIVQERRVGRGLFLSIRVRGAAKLREYSFSGIKGGHKKDLKKKAPLITRGPVRASSIARTVQIVKEFYAEKGRPLATVDVVRQDHDDNTVSLEFKVDQGPKVPVSRIIIDGNKEVSDSGVRKGMKTNTRTWWKFWSRPTFKRDQFRKDLDTIVEKYNERGYFDARVLSDSVYLDTTPGGDPSMVVSIKVHEGPQYHVRKMEWEGNALFTDEQLNARLGMLEGETYNSSRLQDRLYGVGKNNDVSSLYYNNGYMRFNVNPRLTVINGDSLDIRFEVFEGDVYNYGNVTIAGNMKTREHVIRRELYTIPGATFSRDQIQESIRRLMQLNYFTQESLAPGPNIDINEEKKTVDLRYDLEEQGSDQLELSGTWGRFGLVLQLRFGFNNFSAQRFFKKGAWKPLPSGDGQRLSLGIQSNGSQYQQYSLSFTEPWYRGRPTPLGFGLSYSKISGATFLTRNSGGLITFSGNVFYEQRLKWPDDLFSTSTRLGYQYFKNENWISTLPQGISSEITIRQTLTRNSTDHPIFPTSGSRLEFSVELAPPLGGLIQYHKWRFNTSWNVPLTRKLSVSLASNIGVIGSLTGADVQFERFIVGGSPFETQGFFSFFGKEIIYMRGYPLGAIGPRIDNDPFGGRILNKFTSELKWMAIQSQQLSAAPYVFMDAANSWDGFKSYNPNDLFRSAGFGARMFLPILGMVELAYGYNFDTFVPVNGKHSGVKKWTFQFSLGQGFNQ